MAFPGVPAIYIHSLLARGNDLELVEVTGRTRSINRGHWRAETLETELGSTGSVHRQALDALLKMVRVRQRVDAFASNAEHAAVTLGPALFEQLVAAAR